MPNANVVSLPRAVEMSLIKDHLNLVRKIAWLMYSKVGRRVEFDDLLQAGHLGLLNAAQRYVAQPGVSFATYAAIRVRGAILDSMRSGSNLCRTTIAMQQKIKTATHRAEQRLMRSADPAEIAAELGMPTVEYLGWMTQISANTVQSLEQVYSDQSILFQDESTSSEEQLEKDAVRMMLRKCLAELPEREAMVLQLYYVEELTVFAIADLMKVTTGRISQIKKSAIERLRGKLIQRAAA